ncbi:MAG: hypothetical protein R3C03_03290 [Pirellulaceae bacterium]
MMEQPQSAQELLEQLAEALRSMNDEKVGELFAEGRLNDLLTSIVDPSQVHEHKTIADFFVANKQRLATVAAIWAGIHKACSFKSKTGRGCRGKPDWGQCRRSIRIQF